MAMNKKEKEALENALTAAALRSTYDVRPDVDVPVSSKHTVGWRIVGDRVELGWSELVRHGAGTYKENNYMSGSQGGIRLYSTKLLALQALRYKVEQRAAKELRQVDRMIEEEIGETE